MAQGDLREPPPSGPSWIVNVVIDHDKTDVCTITAIYTDADGSTFTASARGTINQTNGTQFSADAIAARNAWQDRKQQEATALDNIISGGFAVASPPETASAPAQANNGAVALNLPG